VKKGDEYDWFQVVSEARLVSDSVPLICYKKALTYLLICIYLHMYLKWWARIYPALSLRPTKSTMRPVFPFNYLPRITSLYLDKRMLYV
jgi:hypothetical protein